MKRIATATRVPDLHGPGKAGFTNGNPNTGEPATACDQEWFNIMQEEVATLLESNGVALNGTKTQLSELFAAKLAEKFGSVNWSTVNASNTSLAPGIYACSANATNTPNVGGTASTAGVLINAAPLNQSQNGAQIWITPHTPAANATPDIHIRYRVGATWYDWNRLWSNANSTSNFAQNGYQKFGNGLILQWGITVDPVLDAGNDNYFRKVTFPTAFTSYCLSAVCGLYTDNTTLTARGAQMWTTAINKTDFYIGFGESSPIVQQMRASWFAIGY